MTRTLRFIEVQDLKIPFIFVSTIAVFDKNNSGEQLLQKLLRAEL